MMLLVSHSDFILTGSPQPLPPTSPRDEVELFNGVLPLAGKGHAPGVGLPHGARPAVAHVGVPAVGHCTGAAVVLVA